MATAYTRRFGFGSTSSSGPIELFVANPDWVWVLRDVIIVNRHTAAQFVQIYLTNPGGGVIELLVDAELEASSSHHLELRQEIEAGEALYAYGAAGAISAVATGYRLSTT